MGANPNTFSFQAIWEHVYQITHFKQPTYRAIASERLAPELKTGDTFHRQYTSDFVVNNLGADGSYSTQALTDTDETLVVNQKKEVSFQVADPDLVQTDKPLLIKYARKAMNRLFLQIDGDILNTAAANSTSTVDDGTLNGTTGNGLTVSVANVANIFTAAQQALQLQNVMYDPNARFAGDVKLDTGKVMPVFICSPQVYQQLVLFVGGKTSSFGDVVSRNGHAGMFMGFNIFVSNTLRWTADLALGTLPTDGDTITINGVTLTFKNTVDDTTAGQVKIASTAALTVTNLTNALNAPGTSILNGANVGYVAVSTANQNKLKNLTATDGTTKVSVVMTGYGTVVVSQVMTAAANIWTAAKQIQHCVAGVNNSVEVIMQQKPKYVINPVSSKVAKDYVTWTLYGFKVFNDQKPQLVDVQINSSTFTAPNNTFN